MTTFRKLALTTVALLFFAPALAFDHRSLTSSPDAGAAPAATAHSSATPYEQMDACVLQHLQLDEEPATPTNREEEAREMRRALVRLLLARKSCAQIVVAGVPVPTATL